MILNRVTPIYLRSGRLRWYRARYVLGTPCIWERRDYPAPPPKLVIPREYVPLKYSSGRLPLIG